MYIYKPELKVKGKFPIQRTYRGKEKTETDVNLATGDNMKENPGEVTAKNEADIRTSQELEKDSDSKSDSQSNEESTTQTEDDLIPKQNAVQIKDEGHTGERVGEGTKFTIDRKIFSSDIWFDSPWKLKIWVYLLGNANHTDGRFMGIPIKRGELIRSYRTIAKDCGYYIGYRFKQPSINTVRRICEDLTKDSRIARRTVQPGTLFSICNYNSLQPFPKPRKVQRKVEQPHDSGTTPVHNKNDKKEKSYNLTSIPIQLSELLLRLIVERRNTFKKPDLQKWARHIDLTIRKDERDPDEIKTVIRWCQADEFWQDTILSTENLREHFDRLALKMNKGKSKDKEEEDVWSHIPNR